MPDYPSDVAQTLDPAPYDGILIAVKLTGLPLRYILFIVCF